MESALRRQTGLDSPVEYTKPHLTVKRSHLCNNKWTTAFLILLLSVAVYFNTTEIWKSYGNKQLSKNVIDTENLLKLEQGGTVFHPLSTDDELEIRKQERQKRGLRFGVAGSKVGVKIDTEPATTTQSSISGSGSGETTTAVESSADDVTTVGSGDDVDATTSMSEISGDDATTDASGIDMTTASSGMMSGDETTTEDASGDDTMTTAPMDGVSGDGTTDMSGDLATTASMSESSGSGDTTTDSSGDDVTGTTSMYDVTDGSGTTTALDMSGDDATTADQGLTATTFGAFTGTDTTFEVNTGTGTDDGAGATTTGQSNTMVVMPVNVTTFATTSHSSPETEISEAALTEIDEVSGEETTFVAATEPGGGGGGGGGAGGEDDGELMVPFYYMIIVGVAGIFLGILIVVIFIYCMKRLKKKKSVTPLTSPYSSQSYLKDDFSKPPEWSIALAREDMILKAIALGQISVLEFALSEGRSAGMMSENPGLMKEAEMKLNSWKRTRNHLEGAYKSRDIVNMEEFMRRFEEMEIKDDTGVYQRCVDLQWNRTHSKLNMKGAADARNEALLMSSIAQFESLQLPPAYVMNDPDYLYANKVMEDIRQEKLLEGRARDEYRMDVQNAITAYDPILITQAVTRFNEAEVPDDYGDIPKANRTLEEIEAKRQMNLDLAMKNMEVACFTRDQESLRQSIEDSRKYGMEERDLKGPEKLLRVVEREDQLIAEVREHMQAEDIPKLTNALIVFKTPVVEMVDKTGEVAQAEALLEKLREKEKIRKIKADVMWRLQNAMAVGDVMAMEGMIKALETLRNAGEEIDEAFLLRAMTSLENARGVVDYRTRMESIKSAIARTAEAENIPQLEDLIAQMTILAEDEKFTMTEDDSRVLDQSRNTLNNLKNKKAVIEKIAKAKPDLTVALVPHNLRRLKDAVDTMSEAKKEAADFDDVFTEEDSALLEDARANADILEHKVEVMTSARERLDNAVSDREYRELKHAIRNAIQAPFIQKKELLEPRKLAVFLDPKARRMAVKAGIRARDIRMLEIALQDLKEAGVEDEVLLLKAERTIDKLQKREKRRMKEEKRQQREDAKRAADIKRLTDILQSAIISRDTEHLQLALEEFEESGYDDEDVPISQEAEELFDNLKIQDLRDRLVDSINRRDLSGLENAVDEADYGGYVMDVKSEYDTAKALLYHLRELKSLREAIAEMNRSLISEIHRYPTPPIQVHQVMTAAFILLGESPKKMKNWQEVQSLLGKLGQNAITRRVRICVPGDISTTAVKLAEQQLKGLKLEELSEISKGAATFFAWTKCMVREYAQVLQEQKILEDIDLPDIDIEFGDSSWLEKDA